MPLRRLLLLFALACAIMLAPASAPAQSIDVRPDALTLHVGETAQLDGFFVAADGAEAVRDTSIVFYSRSRSALPVTRTGEVTAEAPGTHEVIALRPAQGETGRLTARVVVTVPEPPVATVRFVEPPAKLYHRTQVPLGVEAVAASGRVRPDLSPRVETSDAGVASVDRFGRVHAVGTGTATLTATAGGASATHTVTVVDNPVVMIEVTGGAEAARTGDVLDFDAVARAANGTAVEDAPIAFAVRAEPADDLGPGATGQIDAEGRFVAEDPGLYTITATSGRTAAQATVEVAPRDVAAEVEVVGRAQVSHVHTSDLWVWEAADGRDYAVTGTWGGGGEALFWDVTDPADLVPVDTVVVDARTVNDVKVSADGRTCVLSREGASNRKNGIVILDCTDPTDVSVVTEFTENLTGGVHNVFIYEDHVYALSNGRRYDIISIEDRANPRRVGSFELDTPGHAIHDVWVEDGIAYSSNWSDGIVMVDVGNGVKGGSPENPVEITRYAYPSGWNHAAFPYHDEETGKTYVIAGDEAFPNGLYVDDRPTIPAGWLHFIDVTDPDAPKEVARYEVPNAGTHNYWVEGDTLYVAYYNAGLRVVDLSGDLMGNLYEQGREMAHFVPYDAEGRIPNAPMTWGPQPHKGHVFFSDWNSGLWSVKISGDAPADPAQ
jgi:hypothetical protein